MPNGFLDRCIFTPAAGGLSDWVVSAAVPGYLTPTQAGAQDGVTYGYSAQTLDSSGNITAWEVGEGAWNASTSTLPRTNVEFGSNGNVKVNFAAVPNVLVCPLADQLTSASGSNPTATAGPVAIDGSATTFMRSDAAPAVQKASDSQFGIVEVDGTTITASGGVISAAIGSGLAVGPGGTPTPITNGTPGYALTVGASNELEEAPIRTILTGNTNFYVATDGSDSYDGLSPTYTGGLNGPWASNQHAAIVLSQEYDTGGNIITINVGVGSFAGAGLLPIVGGGVIFWKGAGVGSTIIETGPNDGVFNLGECFSWNVQTGAFWALGYMTIDESTITSPTLDGAGILIQAGNQTCFGDPNPLNTASVDIIGNSNLAMLGIANFSAFQDTFPASSLASNIGISGDATICFEPADQSFIGIGGTYTLSGTPAFSTAFINVFDGSSLESFGATFTGSATGLRFSLTINSRVETFGQGTNFFPGDTAGTCDASSSYDGYTFAQATQGGGAPTTSDLPNDETCGFFTDSSGNIYAAVNVAGVIKDIGGAASLNTQVRVTFQASTDEALATDHCSIGVQSTNYNTIATPVELTFGGGNHGFSILAGASITSDWVDFAFTSYIGDVYSTTLQGNNDEGDQGYSLRQELTCNGGITVVVVIDVSAGGPYGMQESTFYGEAWYGRASYNEANPSGSWTEWAVREGVALIETQ